ncbi:MAG: sugar transferase [bacterium]
MLKQYSYTIKRLILLLDIIIIAFCYWMSLLLLAGVVGSRFKELTWILLVSSVVIPVCFKIYGLYNFRYKSFWEAVNKIFISHIINLMTIALTLYIFNIHHFSRIFMVSFFLSSAIIHSLLRFWIKKILTVARIKGYNFRRALIVGHSSSAARIISSIEENVEWGMRVVGIVKEDGIDETYNCAEINKYPIKGKLDDLKRILRSEPVDNVIFCTQRKNITDLKNTILDVETMGISSHVAIPNPVVKLSSTFIGNIDGIPLITYSPIKLSPLELMIKNFVDLLGGLIGFLFFIILYPIISLAIKLDSKGPVLFKQKRMGENGRIFTCYKFRSMYQDAEERKRELLAENQLNGAVFKIKDDPRITRVGKFLRKFSLDEWPQFINVLKREMSLVGTRPPTLDEVGKYELWQKRRLSMKPGLTGLWQVEGRNSINDFNEIVKLDLKYIDNWSIWYEFYIIIKTVFVALGGKNSY